ncbi:hypothetical protein NE471_28460, partial [Escherichia coli]
ELVTAGDQFNQQHITLAGYEKDTQTPADETGIPALSALIIAAWTPFESTGETIMASTFLVIKSSTCRDNAWSGRS